MEKRLVSVRQVIGAARAFASLMEQNTKYPIGVGYRILKLGGELTELSDYAIDRISEVLDLSDGHELSVEESIAYEAMMNESVELHEVNVTMDELLSPSSGVVEMSLENLDAIRSVVGE